MLFSSSFVWAKIISYLEDRLTPVVVATTFDDTQVIELTDDRLVLHSPSEYHREMIRSRFAPYIHDALKEICNSRVELVIFGDRELEDHIKQTRKGKAYNINSNFTFKNFVAGPSNNMAYNSAIAVAKNPGAAYNPLFIYGPPGLGKTHLLHAIANYFHANHPDAVIVNIKGEQFTTELLDAIRSGNNISFRTKYREADLFLIDDIQFIAGKETTQEEFFHTFNALHENGKQIVIISDRKPSDMMTLEGRLQSRFEMGLIVDIQPPDYETRMAIIQAKAESLGLELPDDVCDFIAANVTNNVRQLEGAVKKILAYRNLNNMPLDLPNVTRAINDMFKTEGSSMPTPSLIITHVCRFYSIEESDLRGTLKKKGINEARQVATYLIRKLTNLSLPDIGKEFGRDHTTILHSIRKIEAALKSGSDQDLQNNIRDITANINSSL